jgi:hypothetical protein
MGPNCMGLYVPKVGISIFPGMPSTSGGLIRRAERLLDFLVGAGGARHRLQQVMASATRPTWSLRLPGVPGGRPETETVAAYLEGAKDRRRLAGAREGGAQQADGRMESGAHRVGGEGGALTYGFAFRRERGVVGDAAASRRDLRPQHRNSDFECIDTIGQFSYLLVL